jgi:hypothetical protein
MVRGGASASSADSAIDAALDGAAFDGAAVDATGLAAGGSAASLAGAGFKPSATAAPIPPAAQVARIAILKSDGIGLP